jgi:hypothetical protein
MGRTKNLWGSPNTSTGGNAVNFEWNGTNPNITSYPGVSTADVFLAYARTPEIVDFYYGTWSSGWPTMESMTLFGTVQMQTAQWVIATNAAPIAATVNILFRLGGSAATSGTYEIVYDRWRITTWE